MVPQGESVPFTDPRYHEAHEFLVIEAAALDERRYRDWLALLTKDVTYRMPVRVTTAGDPERSVLGGLDHFDEDYHSLAKRVERLGTDYAWTEDPPSRVRHLVTNVRVSAVGDDLHARSYVLLFRSRGDVRGPEIIVAERRDVLRRTPDGLRLAEREIWVDESVLRTQNLAIFV